MIQMARQKAEPRPHIKKKTGRTFISVYLQDGRRTTISYPRYLLERVLGRSLSSKEDVHHKNFDVTDNQIGNLEIVDHAAHGRIHHPGEVVKCAWCGKEYYLSAKKLNRRKKRNGEKYCCSKSCVGKYANYVKHQRDQGG
jgi:hypothetical protein